MKPLLKRRTVYAATLVGMLVVISGFTFATGLFGGFSTPGSTLKGNQQAFSGGSTIYAAGISGSMFWTSAGGSGGTCTATNPAAGTSPSPVVTAWVSGGPTGCSGNVDYILQLTFTSASQSAGTFTDQFTISSMFGSTTTSYTTSGVSIECVLTGAGTCTAVINIDSGIQATLAQPSLGALDVTVTGS